MVSVTSSAVAPVKRSHVDVCQVGAFAGVSTLATSSVDSQSTAKRLGVDLPGVLVMGACDTPCVDAWEGSPADFAGSSTTLP